MNSTALIEALKRGEYTDLLKRLYLDESRLESQRQRYIDTLQHFEESYGPSDVCVFSVPGRSEVCGNHTDHQRGEVVACSINLDILAVAAKNDAINLLSDGRQCHVELDQLSCSDSEKGTFKSLVKGVADTLKKRGYKVGGFDVLMTSDVLVGSGMSSSAAFEVMIGKIISALYNDDAISAIELAQVSQIAENVYFGKPCGLMDQMACAVGNLIHIDFKDVKNPIVEPLTVDFNKFGYSLCLTDTKGSHANLTPAYAAVPEEMKRVNDFFNKEVLREVDETELHANLAKLRESCGDRAVLRALHVMEENKRVRQLVESLNHDDFAGFLKAITASGNSSFKFLQNVYTNEDPNNQAMSVGLAVSEIALGENGVCRVHGGGFAGTIQAFVKNEAVDAYRITMDQLFGEGSCKVLRIRPDGAVKIIG